nr:hypothetical protein [Streptomyces lavendulae]
MREADAHIQVTHHHINRLPVPRKHPRPDCPFCRIIHDGAPATIVHEWSDDLAIVPRSGGCTDGHLLVFPRGHVADFTTDPVVPATVQLCAAEPAAQIGGQWNYLTSCGPDATQTVFHGVDPAHYALYIEARKRDDSRDGYTLLRVGP